METAFTIVIFIALVGLCAALIQYWDYKNNNRNLPG
jgi:hypothetical protein